MKIFLLLSLLCRESSKSGTIESKRRNFLTSVVHFIFSAVFIFHPSRLNSKMKGKNFSPRTAREQLAKARKSFFLLRQRNVNQKKVTAKAFFIWNYLYFVQQLEGGWWVGGEMLRPEDVE
jgi:hypothetical protein